MCATLLVSWPGRQYSPWIDGVWQTAALTAAALVCTVRTDDLTGLANRRTLFSRGADESHAVVLADRVARAVTAPLVVGGVTVDVGASIGVAIAPEHGRDLDTLLRHADIAMYQAKRFPARVYMLSLFEEMLRRDRAPGLSGKVPG